jgi:tellurite resistance protein
VYLLLLAAFALRLIGAPRSVLAALADPILSPFTALLPIVGMLLALGLQPHAPTVARALFLVCFAATMLLAGWLTGEWIVAPRTIDHLHPGYFLPSVAGGFVGAQGAATLGLAGLGWLGFGVGWVGWVVLDSLLLGRLIARPGLPAALRPTLAIEVAPAALAGSAYFAVTHGRTDAVAYGLAGYAMVMVLVQLRLLPLYRQLAFAPSFWSFTFPWAAVVTDALHWIGLERPAAAAILAAVALGGLSVLVGGIALRSLIALRRGTFLPARPAAVPAAVSGPRSDPRPTVRDAQLHGR